MNSQEEMSLLNLLDLDEEVVDTRLKSIMVRIHYSNEHLTNALQLLRYKYMINMQEKTECNNADEFNFVAKLVKEINTDTVNIVCRITNTVLELNTVTLVSYSEHLLLQILSNIDLADMNSKNLESLSKPLLLLKVCDSVLAATIKHGVKPSLMFLETSLEEILSCEDEKLKVHFITNTVPKLVEGIDGYDILSRIWSHLKQLKGESKSTALKVLSSLSDFYLPVITGENNVKYESSIVFQDSFWDVVLYGFTCVDPLLRKISVYLAKRGVDYVASLNTKIDVISQNIPLFSWDNKRRELCKSQWDNFFILIDSLEEKQSNIVMPSLQLFDKLTEISPSWLNCAYNLGLRHDNGQVRLKCVEYRIKTNINSDAEATVLLGALNDINFYENTLDCKILKDKLSALLQHKSNLAHVLNAIPQAHLSPVPFYHLSDIIANVDLNIESNSRCNVSKVVIEILKASCNIVAIREAIHLNIANFVGTSCKSLYWRDIAAIYAILQTNTWRVDHALLQLIKTWELKENKEEFYQYVTDSCSNIDIGMLYLNNHIEDIDTFMEIIFKKGKTIQDTIKRQYSNTMECFDDVLYILNLESKCGNAIKELLPNAHKTILQYIYCLLSSDVVLNIDKITPLFNRIHFIREEYLIDIVGQLYKTAVLFVQDSQTGLEKIVSSMFIIDSLSHNCHFVKSFGHEMIGLKQLLQLEATFDKKITSNVQSSGRLRNAFYEIHCKLVTTYLCRILSTVKSVESSPQDSTNEKPDWKEIVDYVEKVIDCGGYGCLEWVLRIINETFVHTNSHLNIIQFISKMWNEIEELKSSKHYRPCMKEFINLITQQVLIREPEFNNIVIFYCSKIIEYALINNDPLYYLVHNDQFVQLFEGENIKEINNFGHLVYILSEILLFCPVPGKDQRLADNLTQDIIKAHGEELNTKHHFNFAIQYQALHILSKIDNPNILQTLSTFIKAKIDQTFKAKFSYHKNSQIHRTLQMALQHLLYIQFLKSRIQDGTADWCLDLLARMPHQPSVRICLEWFIAMDLYMKRLLDHVKTFDILKSKTMPLTSQMMIINWLVYQLVHLVDEDIFIFFLHTLGRHLMGPVFNTRLLAQYLVEKIYNEYPNMYREDESDEDPMYDMIIDVVRTTLNNYKNDKSIIKLQQDYFINVFDIVGNLTPLFIYHTLPRLCGFVRNEAVDTTLLLKYMAEIKKHTQLSMNPDFEIEWMEKQVEDKGIFELEINMPIHTNIQDLEVLGTIQKKYIPQNNMSDINVYNIAKKRESSSKLIVVASLIDKLPNLGGMARTSEVFGVKTYVIDSLRHLHDKQFQSLSVSAENWVDVEEVRPGPPLKEYLNRRKAEGYSVVAAEQTSTSSKLQTFKFPKKTLLLLGHEKEGIPCDLLPMMDHCVEIPQQGFVRSLNVHVTAAIFVWEYARQNIL